MSTDEANGRYRRDEEIGFSMNELINWGIFGHTILDRYGQYGEKRRNFITNLIVQHTIFLNSFILWWKIQILPPKNLFSGWHRTKYDRKSSIFVSRADSQCLTLWKYLMRREKVNEDKELRRQKEQNRRNQQQQNWKTMIWCSHHLKKISRNWCVCTIYIMSNKYIDQEKKKTSSRCGKEKWTKTYHHIAFV